MNASDVGVATMTWARSPEEEIVLRRSLEQLATAALPVAVADAGTSPAFTGVVRALPCFDVVIPRERGLVAQVQASLGLAATFNSRFTLYTEPDKERFFDRHLSAFIDRAPVDADVGVVVAARSDNAFATFPPTQRYTEGVINHLVGQVIGVPGDYSYGPFLIARELMPEVVRIDKSVGWGWRHAAFVCAARRGLRIHHIVDEYVCPPDQRDEDDDERRHRITQLMDNLRGLLAAERRGECEAADDDD